MPYAFANAGLLLSTLCLIVSTLFGWMTLMWMIDSLARAEGILSCQEDKTSYPMHAIGWRKIDMTALAELFSGISGKITVQLCIALYAYGVLWAYGSVFASSVSSLFWQFAFDKECQIYANPSAECMYTYYGTLALFAFIVVPLACLDMSEQAVWQLIMTTYRFSAFVVMFVTLVAAIAYGDNPYVEDSTKGTHWAFERLFVFPGFAGIFTTSAVALTFHWMVPDVAQPMKDKRYIRRMATGSLLTASFFYILFGILGSAFFGSHTLPLATLNWQHYTGIGVRSFGLVWDIADSFRAAGVVSPRIGHFGLSVCSCG